MQAGVGSNNGTLGFIATHTIGQGVFEINGTFGDKLRVLDGAILTGTGTLTTVAGGIIQPGNGIGVLSTGFLASEPGMHPRIQIELGGTNAGVTYDQLRCLGSDLSAWNLDTFLVNSFLPLIDQQFIVLNNFSTTATFTPFLGLPQDAVFSSGGSFFQISYIGGDGNDVVLTTVVPEPTIALLAPLGLLARRRR